MRGVRESACETGGIGIWIARRRLMERIHHPPNFGGNDDFVPRNTAQAGAEARFGKTISVMRRSVEQTNASLISLFDRRDRHLLIEQLIKVADRPHPLANHGERQIRPVASFETTHLH